MRRTTQAIVDYLLCYAGLLLLAAAGFWLILQVRINILDAFVLFDWNRWMMGAVDKFGILILALLWLIGVMALEHYLRMGVAERLLYRRLGLAAVVIVVLLGISYGLQWFMLPMR